MTDSPTPKPPVRIGIVEDDRLTRVLIVDMINRESNLELAGHWGSAEEFYENGMKVPMDLLLVDLELPGDNGATLISKAKVSRPDLFCLVLTASDKPEDVFDSLRKGASGYLVKDSSPRELIESIQMAVTDGVSLSPVIARFLVEEFRNISIGSRAKPNMEVLTTREIDVLRKLATGSSPKDVATAIGVSYETVRSHLKKIYQKLHVKTRSEAVALYAVNSAAREG